MLSPTPSTQDLRTHCHSALQVNTVQLSTCTRATVLDSTGVGSYVSNFKFSNCTLHNYHIKEPVFPFIRSVICEAYYISWSNRDCKLKCLYHCNVTVMKASSQKEQLGVWVLCKLKQTWPLTVKIKGSPPAHSPGHCCDPGYTHYHYSNSHIFLKAFLIYHTDTDHHCCI